MTSPAATAHLMPPDPPPEYRVGKAEIRITQPASIVNQKPQGFVSTYNAVINPYSGCTFGCSYCYAAGTSFTRDAARSANWGNWVDVKENAHALIKNAVPGLNGRSCYMATATDPYQPVELQAQVTRSILQALARYHPRIKLVIQTRSPFVVRDLDLMEEIAQAGGKIQVNMTITTADEEIRKAHERGCASTGKRLQAIQEVADAGIQTCITVTPALDLGISPERDQAMLDLLTQAFEHGTKRFIFQSFHIQAQTGNELGAATRPQAMSITREILGLDDTVPESQVRTRYRGAYIDGLRRIKPELEKMGAWVGTNREGFSPPF